MKEINREEMKRIQVEILDCLYSCCKDNNIKWWIEFGTLIGAVRHKGFIPWDDDIDVAMLRNDYEKLKKTFNSYSAEKTGGRFVLLDPELNNDYYYTFGKIIDTDTVLYEGKNDLLEIGVYIDVFVYDNAPSDNTEYIKMIKRRDFLGKFRNIKLIDAMASDGNTKALYIRLMQVLMKAVPMKTINAAMVRNAKKYLDRETGKIAEFLWPYGNFGFYLDSDFFDEIIELEFEGRYYPAPAKYDIWLRQNYGDYMIMPPESERVQHKVRAFLK